MNQLSIVNTVLITNPIIKAIGIFRIKIAGLNVAVKGVLAIIVVPVIMKDTAVEKVPGNLSMVIVQKLHLARFLTIKNTIFALVETKVSLQKNSNKSISEAY